MDYYTIFNENPSVEMIVYRFSKLSKSSMADVKIAIQALYDIYNDEEAIEERLKATCVMCLYMNPSADDAISMLLWKAYKLGKAPLKMFENWYRKDRAEYYYNRMTKACSEAPKSENLTREQEIDHYIMIRVCDKMFNALHNTLKKRGIIDTITVSEAYELAKKAHYWTSRKSGEPYLTHPVSVALILAEVGVDSTIISASLLHDVVEDTDYTINDISEKCGVLVSRYVDAVTSVHKTFAKSRKIMEYSSDKAELDAKSFEKLAAAVSSDPKMVFALYIKAADRIHNLRTIDKMSSLKKHDKTDETELDYLPLFKKFRLNYFVNIIEDLTWRTNNIEFYESVKHQYEDIIERNRKYIDETKGVLSSYLNDEFIRWCAFSDSLDCEYNVEVKEHYYLAKDVYDFARKAVDSDKQLSVDKITKKTVPVCDFDIIVEPIDCMVPMDTFVTMFINMFLAKISPTGRTITDFSRDKDNRYIIEIEDYHRNIFRLFISTREEYIACRIGDTRGGVFTETSDDNENDASDVICYLRNGDRIFMPIGSTVLDVAFYIHPDIGLSAISATINGSPASLYNRIHNEDRIVIKADTHKKTDDLEKRMIPHVRIDWLNHVVTNKARKAITKCLTEKYEGDNPSDYYPASNDAANNVVNRLIDDLNGVSSFENLN